MTNKTNGHKKVAIVGFAKSAEKTPWDDPSFEIWVMNFAEVIKAGFKRFDVILDLHEWDTIYAECHEFEGDNRFDLLLKETRPIYMLEYNDLVPGSRKFPLDELTKEFFPWAQKINGRWDDVYWCSNAQQMVALAIHQGFTEIHLYGIDMADNIEYRAQRRGCEYVLGHAVRAGIKIYRPPECPILRTKFIYGYDIKAEKAYRAFVSERKKWLTDCVREIDNTGMQAAVNKAKFEGMLENTILFEQNWLDQY